MNSGVDKIMVNGEFIAEVYDWYRENKLKVNRTYQRKLVWTLQEKQDLIKSIAKGYPIPLFLLVDRDGKGKALEIIDGLQRLDAIFEFMDNKFKVEIDGVCGYFNVDSCQMTYNACSKGLIHKQEPQLDYNLCHDISRYALAVTTINAEESAVEDVFKKINATGRKLSPQELRQAGITSQFSAMVQDIASRIRGDYTKSNLVNIDEMQKLSLSSIGLDYGVDISKVFWVQQSIISQDNLRRSKDEEIIANLCNCILNNYNSAISHEALDRIYDENSDVFKNNEKLLTSESVIWLTDLVCHIIDDLQKISDIAHKSLMNIWVHADKCYNKDFVFIIITLAMAQLYSEGWIIEDHRKTLSVMGGLASLELSELISKSNVNWDRSTRSHLIERVKRCLKECMKQTDYDKERNQEVLTLLSRSAAEEQMYDFKLGITNLRDGSCNKPLIEKFVKTLVAMANTNPRKEGTIILGLADNQEDAKDFYMHYGVRCSKFNDVLIAGVESEAKKYYHSLDRYKKVLTSGILAAKGKVPDGVLDYILRNMHQVVYNNHVLITLNLSTDKPIFFDGQLYVRHDSNNSAVTLGSTEYEEITAAFYNATDRTTHVFS